MSSIIHFTKKFDTLKSILSQSSFRLKYCSELFYLEDKVSSSAVHPMVSFSEQIISRINRKNITYGKFGIGLKKTWISKKQLHPVLYIDKNSHVANALSDLLKARRKKAETELSTHVRQSIMVIKCFIKNRTGYNSYFNLDNFKFYTEKEWRYVPTKSQIKGNLISQSKRVFEQRKTHYNNKLINFPLEFKLPDIEIIFVETEKQRLEIAVTFGISIEIIKISKWATKLNKVKAMRNY